MSNRKKIRELRNAALASFNAFNDRIRVTNSRLDAIEHARRDEDHQWAILGDRLVKLERTRRIGRDPKIGYIVHTSALNPSYLIRSGDGYALTTSVSVFGSDGQRTGWDMSPALRMNYCAALARVKELEGGFGKLEITWAPRMVPR